MITDDMARKAAEIIIAGGLVAFPTETVYGLGADAFNPSALAKIFEVKKRPRFDPLIIHIADRGSLPEIADIAALTQTARKQADALCRKAWPGPLTLILPKVSAVPDLATSGLPTVAVRFPDHPVAQKLIRLSARAIAAPSANPFGYLSPTTAEHVREQLGNQVDLILDGGPALIGVESTVLDLTDGVPLILRPGGTPKEYIEAVIGRAVSSGSAKETPVSPGQLKSHYAPRIPLILHENRGITAPYSPSEAYLFFNGQSRKNWLNAQNIPLNAENPRIQVLSETGNLAEAAANLFTLLHALDNLPVSAIHAERVPEQGLGNAVNDRLFRAGNRFTFSFRV
ncbi:MAG: threonylcarbamoyl-AMP synthase [Spirochaetaceae bacterium]|jgi:L-threonylcarbamoyladenylate synthase|nr:threonylcarbamoyl-AMP synthase [Spirochaetaceae bacterium]